MQKLFKRYAWWLTVLMMLSLVSNALALIVPKLVADYIDAFAKVGGGNFSYHSAIYAIGGLALGVLAITFVQFIVSTYLSEKVAFDLRLRLVHKLKDQTFAYISSVTSSRLLTNLTSDVDAVKNVISQGLIGVLSGLVTFFGVIVLMLVINWRLALIVLTVLPFLLFVFFFVFGRLMKLFKVVQENIERINKIINESIVGAALVRVLNSERFEILKFAAVNTRAKDIGLGIVKYITVLIPAVMLISNVMTLLIIWFGGHAVVNGSMTLGDMSAFFAYSAMFIWPLFILSFSGTLFSRAAVSLARIDEVVDAPVVPPTGTHVADIRGAVEFKNVGVDFGEKTALKDISFIIKPGTRTAIVGPTAAGKTQILHLISGLMAPTRGDIHIDGVNSKDWELQSLLGQIGLVFQDSIIFNATLRENIQFREGVSEEALKRALAVAELDELVTSLPQGLETLIGERGSNLSGGQKQRLMLARALVQNPKILLLDDFTARVDIATEQQIISNIRKEYSGTTLISITQKIEPIKDYDQIIVVMEGELVDIGTHDELLERSLEYRQIYESQHRAHE